MPRMVEFEGQRFEFPDDASDDEIAQSLASSSPAQAEAPKPRGRDILRAIYGQGLAAGFGDEIEAGVTSLLTGTPYEEQLDKVRGEIEQFVEAHPALAIGGELYGAVVSPGSAIGAIAKGGSAVRGAFQGAAQGMLYGYGTAEGGIVERAKNAGVGGGVGAAGGAAGAKLVDAGKAVVGRVGNAIRGVANQPAEASRRVALANKMDAAGARPGLSDAEFAAAKARGQPVTNIDRGGEMTRALADSAATTSPEARAVFGRMIDDRVDAQGDRVVDYLRTIARTPGNASKTREALQDAAAKATRPRYDFAFRAGSKGLDSPTLQSLTHSPVVQSAMKDAIGSLRNKRAAGRGSGTTWMVNGRPTLEFWDQTKRSLDSQYSVLSRKGDKEGAADALFLKKKLVAELDAAVPAYKSARGVAEEFFDATDALDAGEKFATQNFKAPVVRQAMAKMSQEERDLFREGFVSRIVEVVEASGDRRNVVPKIWGSKAARDKIVMALGPQKAKELEAFMHVESLMNDARSILGGSPTARRLAEYGLAGGATGAGGVMSLVTGNLTGLVGTAFISALAQGKFKIDQRMATRVAEMLASDDQAMFARGVKIIAGNPRLLEALRKGLAVASGSQAAPTYMALSGGQAGSPAQ